eukprot:1635852-Pleurochrysis_carterae.AAC.1
MGRACRLAAAAWSDRAASCVRACAARVVGERRQSYLDSGGNEHKVKSPIPIYVIQLFSRISRNSILLYNIELADKASRLNQVTKQNIIKAVIGASDLAASMLSSGCMAAKKQTIKRQSRKR